MILIQNVYECSWFESILFFIISQDTLDDISSIWNRHKIRPYRQQILKCGRPFMLHTTPSIYGTREYGVAMNETDVRICENELEPLPQSTSDLVKEICVTIMQESNIAYPNHPDEMRDLYVFLREDILRNL
jgi:hypothetical protein